MVRDTQTAAPEQRRRMAAAALAVALVASPAGAQEALNGAVVFGYHRFGEDDLPSTNIRIAQFEEHIAELQSGGYSVLPLQDIVRAMRDGTPLPDRTIAITVDDAYLTTYTEAWPRLRAAGFPFTVFVATDALDAGRAGRSMTWDQVRELAAAGVGIGAHTGSHLHIPEAGSAAIEAELLRSAESFERELGFRPTLFAYPYGEMSLMARDAVIEAGYEAAFGQHSGVAEAGLDPYFLPRFFLSEQYGSLPRFVMGADALPLGARDVVPADPVLGPNPPAFGFTVAPGIEGLDQLNCFASHESSPARLERLGARRFEVRLDTPFPPGRGRFNCTTRAGERWRWFGIQFYIPRP